MIDWPDLKIPPLNLWNIGTMTKQIQETLNERDERYGNFTDHAEITQNLKNVMHSGINWEKLSDDKKEALEMIMHKVGRILNGDPEYKDSWHDIVGYAKLVDDGLED